MERTGQHPFRRGSGSADRGESFWLNLVLLRHIPRGLDIARTARLQKSELLAHF